MARREPADTSPTDPALPFKRRARRRLVGALVIGVGLAVALPLVLDREPRYPKPDIRVEIPPRDAPLPVRSLNEAEATGAAGAARPPAAVNSADAAKAARAEAGRAAEARALGAGASESATQGDSRQPPREPVTQQLDVPPGDGRVVTAGRSEADAARARQEAARQEAARQEAARQEAARQEALRQEAARAQAARQEAARQEAARQEAARQEAARQEAARQEAARLAAANKPSEPTRVLASQNWAVQIGQFARPENAKAAESRVAALGLRAYSETLQTAQGERYRVRTGPFATRTAAEEARSRLLAAGLEAALIAPEAQR